MRAYLALGSNLGDREGALALARRRLAEGGAEVAAASSVDETDPIGVVEQPRFLNQVLEVDTELLPHDLLALAKSIEREAGRDPAGRRWGPRELDIDILIYGDLVVDEEGLTIPHPELGNREFLLRELAELGVSPPLPPR